MNTNEIRQKFLTFFKEKGHAVLPSASLIPENDPSVLFTTAGMHPLVPYLMGQKHPLGNRLASCQKCVRTGDIEEVGNHKNLTFFEMLGNWSLGDYFKKEAITWSYEFLTSKDTGLGLDPRRLYVTVFEGDAHAPRDEEAATLWKSFIPESRIYYLPAKNNWWSPGDNGPCGPDTEMFYDVTPNGLGELTHNEYLAADEKGLLVEIWNDVFMEYEKRNGIVVGKLTQKNVDTGSGLERIAMLMQGKTTVYETDVFTPVMKYIQENAAIYTERSARIVADHIRTATFLIADGVLPSNKDQGYILRRLIRRAVVQARELSLPTSALVYIQNLFIDAYKTVYTEIASVTNSVLTAEEQKFLKTLETGLKAFEKGIDPFTLATTYGFPIELTEELAQQRGIIIDRAAYDAAMTAHQHTSRSGADQKFKGGLANTSDATVRLHTAHHLLLAALQQVLGPGVHQKGSNITEERLRIDFNFERKLTDEEKHHIETIVNDSIKKNLRVERREMPKKEAEQLGAEMEFGATYPEIVSVYCILENDGTIFSKEFCGGPHVSETGVLGTFRILKEEAVAQGIRRIKAVLS